MENAGRIAESLCEAAEELPWRKLLNRGRGGMPVLQGGQASADGLTNTDSKLLPGEPSSGNQRHAR